MQSQYRSYIDALTQCAMECKDCADSCEENHLEFAQLCRDCADLCWICAGALMHRGFHFVVAVSQACADTCSACAKECHQYSSSECETCASACRRVVEAHRAHISPLYREI